MSDMIKLSFVTTFVLSLLNLIIYFVLSKTWKKPLLEQMTLYWLSVIILFFIQIPMNGAQPLVIGLAFSFNLIPSFIICKIYLDSFQKTLNMKLYLFIHILAMLCSISLHSLGFSFTTYTLPIVFSVLLPPMYCLIVFYQKRKAAKMIHAVIAIVLFYSIGTSLNFAINRLTTDPTTLWWGWLTATFTYILNSSFLPFFILHEIFSSEEKRLNKIIEERTQDLTTLSSILSHDMSNALQIIDMSLTRAIKTKQEKFLDKTSLKVKDAISLLLFVKTYFKNKDNHKTVSQLYLENALIQTVDDYYEIAAQKGIKIKVTSELPMGSSILVDQNLFKTCLLGNIIKNSIKFSNEGDVINIRALKDIEGRPTIIVKDTGVGMNESQLDSVFLKTGKSTFGTLGEMGTGLGLPIVKELMEGHGGHVSISSKVNHGTSVTLTF